MGISADDFAVGQGLLELGHAGVGDVGILEGQLLEVGHACEVFQPSIRNLRAIERQLLKSRQAYQIFHACVSDFGFAKRQ